MFNLFSKFLVLCLLSTKAVGKEETDGYEVTQIHIAQGRTPESMTVSWVTKTTADSVVKFGLSEDKLDQKAQGYASSYSFDYPSYDVYQSGVIHHVTLEKLQPSTVYYYQAGDFTLNTSGILSFKTMPAVGDLSTLSFGVIGDLGTTNDSESTIHHLIAKPRLGMILHAGDLSYADCKQQLWDSYGELIEDLARERPWMVGPGNHEIEFNNNGSMFLAFEERYRMPAIAPAEIGEVVIEPSKDSTGKPYCASSVFQSEYNYGNSFYSFETGPAHIIYLNPYSVTNSTSKQYTWLVKDLESVDRQKTPWIIVVMHCPWYNSNTAHQQEKQAVLMKESMEPLLYKHHVNVVFTGHVHAYERTNPVYLDKNTADGVVYFTIGDGGNAEGHAINYQVPSPEWSAYRNGTQYGHGEVTLLNKDKLIWTWNRNVDGKIIWKDSVVLCNTAFHDSAINC